jgi:hypothetical protein
VQAKLDGMVEDAVAEAVAGIGLSAEDEARIRREEQERHVRQIRECVREASGRRSSGTRAERFLDRLLEIPTEEEQPRRSSAGAGACRALSAPRWRSARPRWSSGPQRTRPPGASICAGAGCRRRRALGWVSRDEGRRDHRGRSRLGVAVA